MRAGYGEFKSRMKNIRDHGTLVGTGQGVFDVSDFVLFTREFEEGIVFAPGLDNDSWILQPLKKDDTTGWGGISGDPQVVEKIAEDLLRMLSSVRADPSLGLKMNVSKAPHH